MTSIKLSNIHEHKVEVLKRLRGKNIINKAKVIKAIKTDDWEYVYKEILYRLESYTMEKIVNYTRKDIQLLITASLNYGPEVIAKQLYAKNFPDFDDTALNANYQEAMALDAGYGYDFDAVMDDNNVEINNKLSEEAKDLTIAVKVWEKLLPKVNNAILAGVLMDASDAFIPNGEFDGLSFIDYLNPTDYIIELLLTKDGDIEDESRIEDIYNVLEEASELNAETNPKPTVNKRDFLGEGTNSNENDLHHAYNVWRKLLPEVNEAISNGIIKNVSDAFKNERFKFNGMSFLDTLNPSAYVADELGTDDEDAIDNVYNMLKIASKLVF